MRLFTNFSVCVRSLRLPMFRKCNTSSVTADTASIPKPFSEMPTPKGSLPLLGHYFRIRHNFSEETKRMFEEVKGPIFKLKVPGSVLVLANDSAAAEAMRHSEGQYPSRGALEEQLGWFYNQRKEPTPFSLERGPEWRKGRTQLGKQLAPANVYGYVPGFNRATDRLISNIKEVQDSEGYVNDMEELISYWSLEVGAYFTYGADLDAQKDHKEEAERLSRSVRALVSSIDDFTRALPLYKLIPTRLVRDTNKAVDDLNDVGRMYAKRHMDRIKETVEKGEKELGQSLLEQWLIEKKMSSEEAVQIAGLMMAAGMDTTVHTLGFLLYELSKHRDIQDKLYNQIYSVLGEKGEPDTESLQKMPYIMSVIKEGQRMNTVIGVHIRVIAKDTTILGYVVPAGTTVIYNLYSAKDKDEHYKDAERFDPDRWTRDDISPYASLPFGVGPRMCWGRRFAEIEMKILLSKLSQHFIMESDEPLEARLPFAEKSVIRPSKNIRIKFIARK